MNEKIAKKQLENTVKENQEKLKLILFQGRFAEVHYQYEFTNALEQALGIVEDALATGRKPSFQSLVDAYQSDHERAVAGKRFDDITGLFGTLNAYRYANALF